MRRFGEVMLQYTVDGMMGHLLDAEADGLQLADFTTFEIEELMNLGDKYALPTLLYLFRRIERSVYTVNRRQSYWMKPGLCLVIRYSGKKYANGRGKSCVKPIVRVLMATQNLSDAANSGILDVIVESTATKIFLPNVHARDEEASALYRRMGLNTRQSRNSRNRHGWKVNITCFREWSTTL